MKLQRTSQEVYESKYCLKERNETVETTIERVAQAIANIEETKQDYWYGQFKWAMENGAIPAGRIMSNAGAEQYKPKTSLINCTVSGGKYGIEDSMDGIMTRLHEAALTLKAGCGIGYNFGTLRPNGAYVNGSGAQTSGPLPFMDIFDRMCQTVSSAGGRRGAQMATFPISHPDVMDFIKAKRETGRFRNFNCSLLISDEFMSQLKEETNWNLQFNGESYTQIPATTIWDTVMQSTYDYAEPGVLFVDRINKLNNLYFCEEIFSCNPCGEQPLPAHGACLLGSINLTKFVVNPFSEHAYFDYKKFTHVVAIFTRMLDNVADINGLPLLQQREELKRKRRHGMGYLGLGSALTMLCVPYGSAEAIEITEEITKQMAVQSWKTGVQLSKEKGPAPIMEEEFTITNEIMQKSWHLRGSGWKVGDKLKGKHLIFTHSEYMKQIADYDQSLGGDLSYYGSRFTHATSIAPTGTIALSFGNNASNGIEPSFSHKYSRNIIVQGKKTKEQVDVYSYEYLLYCEMFGPTPVEELPGYFITADALTPEQHIRMQAAAQKWVDSSISKTINVPTDTKFEDFKAIYQLAYDLGLKGCTTYRYSPDKVGSVLTRASDLESTTYIFTLTDGSQIKAKGSDTILYDGEQHNAANLHDAIKGGMYAKF